MGRISGEAPLTRTRRIQLVTEPSAGSDWSITVPGSKVWDIRSILATFVTSATVANRAAFLYCSDGTTTFLKVPPQSAQAASNTWQYMWWPDAPEYTIGGGVVTPMPHLVIPAGYKLSASTTLIDAGDQWSAIAIDLIETIVTAGAIDISDVPEFVVQLPGWQMQG